MSFFKSTLFLGVLSLSQFAFSAQKVVCTSANHDVIAIIDSLKDRTVINLTVAGKKQEPVALMGMKINPSLPIQQWVSADQSNYYNVQLIKDPKTQGLFAQLFVKHLNLIRQGKTALRCYIK
ncbi:MAG: hypothetical protein AABY64_10710 [Bdellovibrionota bacterium]